MSEKTVWMTLLYDFFGDLLTEKQKEYFDLYYNEDLSLSEIAENTGISRQGVRDMLVRAESALIQYEEKTGIVSRFENMQKTLNKIEENVEKLRSCIDDREKVEFADKIIDEIRSLKGY